MERKRSMWGFLRVIKRLSTLLRETGPVNERPVPFPLSTREPCSCERLAPERRGPRPASEEGKLELTEAP